MMVVFGWLVLTGVCLALCPSYAHRILVVPVNIPSHVHFMGRLAMGLAGEGHNITMIFPTHVKPPDFLHNSDVEIVKHNVKQKGDHLNAQEAVKEIMQFEIPTTWIGKLLLEFQGISSFMKPIENDCENMFADRKLIQKLKSSSFEFALMDFLGHSCHYALPYSMDIPYGSVLVPTSQGFWYRVPELPSFVPNRHFDYTDHMTFSQRLQTLLIELSMPYLVDTDESTRHYLNRYAPQKATLDSVGVVMNSNLCFHMDDVTIRYSRPLMPNTIPVGDILCRPAKPLPSDLEIFVQEAQHGVIVMSMGSLLDQLPTSIIDKFCQAFRKISQRIIWKLGKAELCDIPGKLLSRDWLPQNDLLGHSNVKLLITHGGVSSILETLYHAKPAVVVPLFYDQPLNAKHIETNGYGTSIDFSTFSPDELVAKLHQILADQNIHRNLRRASALLRDKPETAAKRASYWIDHVIKHGSKHLGNSAMDLNIFQFYMMDLFLFIFIVIIAVILFLVALCWMFARNVRRLFTNKSKIKQN